MSLKKSHGNMYDWVTHMHSHLGGECPHKCSYCYVQKNRFGVSPRYRGGLCLYEDELKVNYGDQKVIFIEHMNDLFAEVCPDSWITQILDHCHRYPANRYVFQTKNPGRAIDFLEYFPPLSMIGTTIETNRENTLSLAPAPVRRYEGILQFDKIGYPIFLTIEPIMDFDSELLEWVKEINPHFVNIGADSKHCNLPEPNAEKIEELIAGIQEAKITIKKKTNLVRLLNPAGN